MIKCAHVNFIKSRHTLAMISLCSHHDASNNNDNHGRLSCLVLHFPFFKPSRLVNKQNKQQTMKSRVQLNHQFSSSCQRYLSQTSIFYPSDLIISHIIQSQMAQFYFTSCTSPPSIFVKVQPISAGGVGCERHKIK